MNLAGRLCACTLPVAAKGDPAFPKLTRSQAVMALVSLLADKCLGEIAAHHNEPVFVAIRSSINNLLINQTST
jgi:hypothetical protein